MQQMMQRAKPYPRLEATAGGVVGGAVAGALAGGLSVALAPLASLLTGAAAWSVPAALGSAVLGSAALVGGTNAGVVMLGALVMVAVGGALGALFGLLFRALSLTTDFGLAIYSSLGYGVVLFLAGLAGVPVALELSAETLLVAVLSLTTLLGLFYTALCPAPYASAAA